MAVAPSVPTTQEQHMHMQMQQRQQQQQFSAAMAARHNAQQQQAAAMATMMGQQIATSMAQQTPQMQSNSSANIHVASLMGSQGMAFQVNTSSEAPTQPQQSAVPTGMQNPVQHQQIQAPLAPVVPVTSNENEEPCLICGKKGDIFTCNGGCALNVHPACIGEDAIFPFVGTAFGFHVYLGMRIIYTYPGLMRLAVGQLCGSCFIVQQNRASQEDLTKGGPNALSVRRAILCVNLETNSNLNFDKFGHLASLRLGEIGSIAGYPIKPFAEKFVEPYLQRWIREKLTTAGKWMLNVREIFTVMIGLYSLKRACVAHGLHDKVIELMKARKFTVMDFFGWHPAIEGPSVRCSSLCAVCGIRNAPEVDVCSRCHHKLVFPSVFTKYISTLLAAFYAEQVGIPLGASTLDVFAHTNTVRGLYKGLRPFDADGVVWEQFTDQLSGVHFSFRYLYLFVPEVNIIFNPAYVNQAMITNEFEVVGKFLQCMRLFGHAKSVENEHMIESVQRYVLFKHLPNGSWCKMNGSTVDQYKATVTCSKALLTPDFRGYGPISHDFQRLLEKWARNAAPKLPSAAMAGAKQPAETSQAKAACFWGDCEDEHAGEVKASRGNVQGKVQYGRICRQTAPKGGTASLESLMTERMRQLIKAKKLEDQAKAATAAEEKKVAVKEEKGSVKEETHPAPQEAASSNEETSIKKEDIATDGATDSEDIKSENQPAVTTTAEKDQDDDDVLTNMSLHEDLEIFDGLQFEDGGGIIDMSFHSLGPPTDVDEDNGEPDIEDPEGTDAPGQDDDDEAMDDHVYDDDEDENEDSSSHVADGDTSQQEVQVPYPPEAIEAAGTSDATSDFPSDM
ncbi:hypothetical protein ON010_g2269 [Phytophthora cinnamomi]|nr:hypothetical protein ON010_g2269 [Phytophthora cinnamomi]